jgi:hypothetical protein
MENYNLDTSRDIANVIKNVSNLLHDTGMVLYEFTNRTDESVELLPFKCHMRGLKRSYDLIQDHINAEWRRQKKQSKSLSELKEIFQESVLIWFRDCEPTTTSSLKQYLNKISE